MMSTRPEAEAEQTGAPPGRGLDPPLFVPGDLEYGAVLAVATALSALPAATRARVLYQLSRVLGTIWYRTNRGAVRRVRHHLQYLFGYRQADATLESLVHDQLVLSTWNAMVINLLPSLRDEHLAGLLQVQGLHYIDENRRQGRAVALLGAHYGAYGYAVAACLSAHGHSIWLVGYGDSHSPRPGASRLYRRLYWPRVQRLMQRIKTITINPAQEWQLELRPVLEQKGETVYLLPDQYFVVPPGRDRPANLAPLRFLGRTVYLDIQGVQLVKEMGAQPLIAIPIQDGYRQCILIEPMEWAGAGLAWTDLVNDLQIYMTRLEQHLVQYPALWRDLRRTDLLPRMGVFESQTANG